MIRAHFHIYKEQNYCHVYSSRSAAELIRWMKNNGIPIKWLQIKKIPHVDLWGMHLKDTKDLFKVSNQEFAKDIEAFKQKGE